MRRQSESDGCDRVTRFPFEDKASVSLRLENRAAVFGGYSAWTKVFPSESNFAVRRGVDFRAIGEPSVPAVRCRDRKSTRLNSSHGYISYAVFCLKKKK